MFHHLLFHRRRKAPNYPVRRLVGAAVLVLAGIGFLAHGCSASDPTQPTTSEYP